VQQASRVDVEKSSNAEAVCVVSDAAGMLRVKPKVPS
jgi:hypothetical protein